MYIDTLLLYVAVKQTPNKYICKQKTDLKAEERSAMYPVANQSIRVPIHLVHILIGQCLQRDADYRLDIPREEIYIWIFYFATTHLYTFQYLTLLWITRDLSVNVAKPENPRPVSIIEDRLQHYKEYSCQIFKQP